MQAAGYRVNQTELSAVVQLHSATQGIGFVVRLGSPSVEEGAYLDFTFSCALRVLGELPTGLVGLWNASRRFTRLSVQGEFLVMEMDVLLNGGVGADYMRSNLELWDRLLQEFVVYLRENSQHAAQLSAEGEKPEVTTKEEVQRYEQKNYCRYPRSAGVAGVRGCPELASSRDSRDGTNAMDAQLKKVLEEKL